MAIDVDALIKVVYDGIDNGSGVQLPAYNGIQNLVALSGRTLLSLQMTAPGIQNMWQVINAHVAAAGGAQVSQAAQKACKSVDDVWAAVYVASGISKGTKMGLA